jgi:hypothetical protein
MLTKDRGSRASLPPRLVNDSNKPGNEESQQQRAVEPRKDAIQ